jgi:ABC-type branched-subunit amino acid transport system ATPase component/branched-subunit amino acid ABC-type transport system permease component
MHDLLPFIVIGLTTGSVYGLAATGLVLSYKTSGIFNFAYGAIAALAVFVFYWLHVQHGMAWPLAAVLSVLVLGPAMGLLLELLARRLERVDHTLQIAATIGLVLWIVGIGSLWLSNVTNSFPSFLPTSTVGILGVNVEWEQIIVVIVSLLGSVGLYFFLKFVRLGRAMRAVVDDPALLAMVGDDPVGVRRWAWVVSSTFACAAGLLIAPSLPIEATVLTLLVVQAFGAAAIGYFSNLPLVYVGGLVLGIAGALTTKYVNAVPWLINLPAGLPFIILIIVLLVTPRARLATRRFVTPIVSPPSWQAPVRIRIGTGVLFVGLLCAIPALVGTDLTIYTSALVLVILLLSLGLLVRTSRQVSLCQYAFAAIGAAAMGHFTSEFGIPWILALLLAGLVAVPVGALVAIPAIRLPGVFLALATLGFGILLEQVFYDQNYMFSPTGNGIATTRPALNIGAIHAGTDTGYFFVVLLCVVIVAVVVIVITETRLGRLLRAMGDSPLALESYGLSVNVTRVLVFCLSAYIAAISGALTAGLYHYALPSDFPSFNSLTLFVLVIIVVVGDPWYAVIAAASITLIPVYLTSNNITNYLSAIFGIGAVLTATYRDKIQGTPPAMRRLVERIGRPRPKVRTVEFVSTTPDTGTMQADAARTVQRPRLRSTDDGLAVQDLSVRFGGVIAVNGVSFAAPLGTITGLIGPNGAGKTTIFNACSGLVSPNHGRISLLGDDVSGLSAAGRARRGLGRTFQRVQLFETLSVRTNVELARECTIAGSNPLRHLISRRREERDISTAVRNAVDLTGIEPLLDSPVKDLSTGQRRLVELTRVLAGPFDIVLLDEPSSGLDHNETRRLGDVLVRVVQERGVGLLLVEHDMSLVRQVCSNIYVLDFGNLIFEGSPAEMSQSEVVKIAYLGEGDDGALHSADLETSAVEGRSDA